MMAIALFVLPGPTLVLMLLLTVPYLIFLAGMQPGRRPSASRLIGSLALSVFLVALMIVLGQIFFAARLNQLASGEDASFFGRFTGPMLVAYDMLRNYSWAGAGLTGEPFIADRVMNVYMNSPAFKLGVAHRTHRRRAQQLFLAALDLSRRGVGRGLYRGGFGVAAHARRAQRALLLGRMGDPGPGVRFLCRPQDLERAADGGGCLGPTVGARRDRAAATSEPQAPTLRPQLRFINPPAGLCPIMIPPDTSGG